VTHPALSVVLCLTWVSPQCLTSHIQKAKLLPWPMFAWQMPVLTNAIFSLVRKMWLYDQICTEVPDWMLTFALALDYNNWRYSVWGMKSFLLDYFLKCFRYPVEFQKLVSCYLQASFHCIYLLLNRGVLYFEGFSCSYACLYPRDN